MAEISELILNGSIDYITGEYLGNPCGYPKTRKRSASIRCNNPDIIYNKYGYDMDSWGRMKECTRTIIKYLYEHGYKTIKSRQEVLDKFLFSTGVNRLPKNSRAYHMIWEKYDEFKLYVKQLRNKK